MKQIGDFHIHSTFSDGTLTPSQVVSLAKQNGVANISLTDHDNTLGIDEAMAAGASLGVNVIAGVELSTIHNKESIHVLGYFNDNSYKDPTLIKYFDEHVNHRVHRAEKIVAGLKRYFSVSIDLEKVLAKADKVVGRPHIAKTIIEAGYNLTHDEIFATMLSKDSPAYFPTLEVSIEDGIKTLKKYGATVILAHPVLIRKTPLDEILKYDFDGIEAIHFQNKKNTTKRFVKLAKERNLLITAGSDFHTDHISDTRHGTIGECFIEGTELENFLSFLDSKRTD